MGMDVYTVNDREESNLKSSGTSRLAVSNGENGIIETDVFTNMLTRLEIDLAYSSEKLVNLDHYMTVVSLEDNRLREWSQSQISEEDIERDLISDLLFGYIDCEVTELEHVLSILQVKITSAHQKIYPCEGHTEEPNAFQQKKLHQFGNSWKDLQEKVSKMKQHLAQLHRTLSSIRPNDCIYLLEDENSEGSGFDFGQRRLVLGMLEKSLAEELDLKRQLLESREREEEQKLKLLHANEVVSQMETFAEIALERLLEAEYSSEMFMRLAKEMMFRFQILQFNLQCSAQREGEMKSELQRSLEQLKKKEHVLAEIQRNSEKMRQSSQDKETLEEKVKLLEKKLRDSESKLQEANDSYEASQEQFSVMEDTIESLRERVFMAEDRAHSAETDFIALTQENMELREEVGFLKVGDGNEEKGLLEKQVRDLEAQLQTARAASDMLYTAIWDMETLVEELKSKLSNAESRAQNAEEQCLLLAESNLELTKEVRLLKSKSMTLEENLKENNRANAAWGKDISNGAKLITEMVMQLAAERERIQKQLLSLARENKILLQELRKVRKNNFKGNQSHKEDHMKELGSAGISRAASATEDLGEKPSSVTSSNQVDENESSEHDMIDEAEAVGSSNDAATDFPSCENESKEKPKHLNKTLYLYIFAAIFVLFLSILAMNISWQDNYSLMRHQYLGLQ